MTQKYNKIVDYVDATTEEYLFSHEFHDPELGWIRLQDGSYILNQMYGGYPTTEWLQNNPRPMR